MAQEQERPPRAGPSDRIGITNGYSPITRSVVDHDVEVDDDSAESQDRVGQANGHSTVQSRDQSVHRRIPFTVYGLRVQDCALALTIGQVRDLHAIAEKTCTPVAVSTLTVAGQHNSKIGALPANGRIKHHDWAYADHFT